MKTWSPNIPKPWSQFHNTLAVFVVATLTMRLNKVGFWSQSGTATVNSSWKVPTAAFPLFTRDQDKPPKHEISALLPWMKQNFKR